MTLHRVSPSANVNFLACEHLAALAKGALKRPFSRVPSRESLATLGQHEQAFRAELRMAQVTETSACNEPYVEVAGAVR